MEQKDWDKLKKDKGNKILLNMAINNISGIWNSGKAILEEEDTFKKQVKHMYALYQAIHKEVFQDGKDI